MEAKEFTACEANLAMMLRRMIWMIGRRAGNDDSLTALAGKAGELLKKYGLTGSVLRDENK